MFNVLHCQSMLTDEVSSVVTPSGLEPETCCLEGSCSIQLSYEAIFSKARANLLHFVKMNNLQAGNHIFIIDAIFQSLCRGPINKDEYTDRR